MGKKYNPMKAALASARVGLRGVAVFHSEKSKDEKYTAHAVNYKKGCPIAITESMAFAFNKIRHLWNIHLVAIGVESNGKKRFEVDYVPLKQPLLQSDLVEYLNERHNELAEKFKERNTLTNLAWLAVPNGDDIELEQIDKILTDFKAW